MIIMDKRIQATHTHTHTQRVLLRLTANLLFKNIGRYWTYSKSNTSIKNLHNAMGQTERKSHYYFKILWKSQNNTITFFSFSISSSSFLSCCFFSLWHLLFLQIPFFSHLTLIDCWWFTWHLLFGLKLNCICK